MRKAPAEETNKISKAEFLRESACAANECCVFDDETLDDLQVGGCRLIQKKTGFRFGMDSVLLSHFVSLPEHASVADFGAGAGVLTVLLAAHKRGNRFYAFEIQTEIAEMMRRSVRLNGFEDIVIVYDKDVQDSPKILGINAVDAVVCNPPYSEPGTFVASVDIRTRIARQQDSETIDVFLAAAYSVLRGKGRLFLVYPAHSLMSIMNRLTVHGIEPKRIRLVHPYADRPARLVMIEAVKNARPSLNVLPPLIVYERTDIMTSEMKKIYDTG